MQDLPRTASSTPKISSIKVSAVHRSGCCGSAGCWKAAEQLQLHHSRYYHSTAARIHLHRRPPEKRRRIWWQRSCTYERGPAEALRKPAEHGRRASVVAGTPAGEGAGGARMALHWRALVRRPSFWLGVTVSHRPAGVLPVRVCSLLEAASAAQGAGHLLSAQAAPAQATAPDPARTGTPGAQLPSSAGHVSAPPPRSDAG